jgi:hypothetical protein
MLAVHINACSIELIAQHTSTHELVRQVQFVNTSHQRQIGSADQLRPIVDAAAADTDQLGLSFNRKCMGAVDYRFALSNPTLMSALSKKSFSSVSWPILACKVFTSTGGGRPFWIGQKHRPPHAR